MDKYYSWHDVELAARARERGKTYDAGAIEYVKRRIGHDITQDLDGGIAAIREAHRLDGTQLRKFNGWKQGNIEWNAARSANGRE